MQVKQGDIFQLGDHRIACGKAEDKDLVKRLIGEEKIRLICCDPPYGCAFVENKDWLGLRGTESKSFKKFSKIEGDHLQSEEEYSSFTEKWLSISVPYLQQKNAFYVFNSDIMICALRKGIEKSRGHCSQMIIWIKNSIVLGRKDYNPQHELIQYGWFGSHRFERSKAKSVIFCPKPLRNSIHPTQKPPELLRKLILNSTKINEIVYDPFLGSSSTLIACEQIKRKCFGIELSEEYIEKSIQRWEKLTGLKAKKIYGK